MYASIKSALFALIPNHPLDADHIYLGMIAYIIATFMTGRVWPAFIGVLALGLVMEGLDIMVLGHTAGQSIYDLLHFITVPLLISVFVRRTWGY